LFFFCYFLQGTRSPVTIAPGACCPDTQLSTTNIILVTDFTQLLFRVCLINLSPFPIVKALLSLSTNVVFYCDEMQYCQANLRGYFVVRRMSRFHGRHFTDRAEHVMKASLDARAGFVSETVGVYDYTASAVVFVSFQSCRCLKFGHSFKETLYFQNVVFSD
jgi:hypothetical protein